VRYDEFGPVGTGIAMPRRRASPHIAFQPAAAPPRRSLPLLIGARSSAVSRPLEAIRVVESPPLGVLEAITLPRHCRLEFVTHVVIGGDQIADRPLDALALPADRDRFAPDEHAGYKIIVGKLVNQDQMLQFVLLLLEIQKLTSTEHRPALIPECVR
jgi:hypothetical protein